MKMTLATLALSAIVALATTTVMADDPTEESIDCFYQENQADEFCQAAGSAKPTSSLYAESESIALQSMNDESVDCFYDASRWDESCAVAPQIIASQSAVAL